MTDWQNAILQSLDFEIFYVFIYLITLIFFTVWILFVQVLALSLSGPGTIVTHVDLGGKWSMIDL